MTKYSGKSGFHKGCFLLDEEESFFLLLLLLFWSLFLPPTLSSLKYWSSIISHWLLRWSFHSDPHREFLLLEEQLGLRSITCFYSQKIQVVQNTSFCEFSDPCGIKPHLKFGQFGKIYSLWMETIEHFSNGNIRKTLLCLFSRGYRHIPPHKETEAWQKENGITTEEKKLFQSAPMLA